MKMLLYSGPASGIEIIRRVLGHVYEIQAAEAVAEVLLPLFECCTVFLDASMKVPIRGQTISRAKNLKLVVTATTGADHIDQSALRKRGIPLLTLKEEKEFLREITSAAEHSWLLLMACARRLTSANSHVQSGKWERNEFPGIMMKGKTLGVIGLGRIGEWMARYANAFGMRVIGYDPFVERSPERVEIVDLETLVSGSDFITIHVHLTPDTEGLLNASLIGRFKNGCIFVNTSRGGLVDEKALVDGLKEGRIGAVGVDCLSGEPEIIENPLWEYAKDSDKVVITPHIGGYCPEAVNLVLEFSAQRILEFGEN